MNFLVLVFGDVFVFFFLGFGWVTGDFVGYGDEVDLSRALADLDVLVIEVGGEVRFLPVLFMSMCYDEFMIDCCECCSLVRLMLYGVLFVLC